MTTWQQEILQSHKDMWHWMGIAISLARSVGLNRDPTTAAFTESQRNLRKRVWWCCVMRDRLIALGARAPLQIREEDFDVPILQKANFLDESVPERRILADFPTINNLNVEHDLATFCISMIKLCLCIGHMLGAHYVPGPKATCHGHNDVDCLVKLFPRLENNTENVGLIEAELEAWDETLHPTCRHQPLTHLDTKQDGKVSAINRAVLHMLYNTTVIALHQPRSLPKRTIYTSTITGAEKSSRNKIRDASASISLVVADLDDKGLDTSLPLTAVTANLFAMVVNLTEVRLAADSFHSKAGVTFATAGAFW